MSDTTNIKNNFLKVLKKFTQNIEKYLTSKDKQWLIKGFIDIHENIYTISNDTKIISKILEIHLFPRIIEFAEQNHFKVVLAEKQNWYPDISFVSLKNEKVKFALDIKTTYRLKNSKNINGFTLGSHGEYFINRQSNKNIQYPYTDYLGHYCLGIIYDRNEKANIEETKIYKIQEVNLEEISSVISNLDFFVCEKWQIASDKAGSGNTANIGSIKNIYDLLNAKGIFKNLGEEWFDDYWKNYGKITINKNGKDKKITNLVDFLEYRGRSDLKSKILK